MNRSMKMWITLTALVFLLVSCERKIDFELRDTTPRLVVEATIENDKTPRVILTRSIGYFSEITPQLLLQSFVHGAEVFISNGTLTHQLKEYTIPLGGGISLYYYSIDSADLSTAFVGELDHAYSLRVVSEGKEYTATTRIPKITKQIDSLWWKPVPAPGDTSLAVVMVKVTDPPGYGDYIRYFTSINDTLAYLPPVTSVYDDLFIDGTTYEVQIQPGVDRNADSTESDFFNRGDTVNFKISNIDKATFDFWRTWEFSYSSIGNPFSTPTKIFGNISNEALGYFGGYASQYRLLIIPK